MGGIITDMEDFKDTHFRENVKEMAADLDWATGEIVTLLVGPGGLEERWGDALPGAIRMAQHVAAVFEAIASVAESIESAADNGGIDIEAGWAMLNQLVALAGGFKAIQAVPTFGDLSNIGPGELGPGPQDHFLGAGDGGDNGPWDVKVIGWKELPPVTVELTINVAGDNGKVVHFTEQAKVGETLRRELSASL